MKGENLSYRRRFYTKIRPNFVTISNYSFREIFLISKGIQITIESMLIHFPSEDDVRILYKLFSICFQATISSTLIVQLIRTLSCCILNDHKRKIIAKLIWTYQSGAYKHQENIFYQWDEDLAVLFAREKVSIQSIVNEYAKYSSLSLQKIFQAISSGFFYYFILFLFLFVLIFCFIFILFVKFLNF